LPFWLDNLRIGHRGRLRLRRKSVHKPWQLLGETGTLIASIPDDVTDDAVFALCDALAKSGYRIAPRALTLTMYLRLVACDLFVHGIGGGHYDQVLDRILRSYFKLEPPTFAVASATLFHPDAVDHERVDLSRLKQEKHHIVHQALGDDKPAWLRRIASTPDFHMRRNVFEQMHAARRQALTNDADYLDWQQRWADTQRRLAVEAELFDRELWFAVQPRDRLANMIDRVRRAVHTADE
ncbi:MAG: hypothetical protein AAGK78_03800, partial [Planctomycetota bacterium]